MSRTTKHMNHGHRFRSTSRGWLRRAITKGERHQVRQALHGAELIDPNRDSLEVLADLHEEQGRLELAERIRSGHDPVLPLKPGERVPRW